MLEIMKTDLQQSVEDMTKSLTFSLKKLKDREERLTDAYLDRVIDRETYMARKESLLNEQIEIEEQMQGIQENSLYDQRAQEFYQLIESLKKLPNLKIPDEIRNLLKRAISNISVYGKCIEITWDFPVRTIFSVPNFLYSGAHKGQCRTFTSHESGCNCKIPQSNTEKIIWSKERAHAVARAVLMGKEECEREEEKYREM